MKKKLVQHEGNCKHKCVTIHSASYTIGQIDYKTKTFTMTGRLNDKTFHLQQCSLTNYEATKNIHNMHVYMYRIKIRVCFNC